MDLLGIPPGKPVGEALAPAWRAQIPCFRARTMSVEGTTCITSVQ
jgi:hypothetical protein